MDIREKDGEVTVKAIQMYLSILRAACDAGVQKILCIQLLYLYSGGPQNASLHLLYLFQK